MGMDHFGLNRFDAIVYINVDHRKDKQRLLLEACASLDVNPEKLHRIPSYFDVFNGHRGCAYGHIQALLFAEKHGFENVLILEDDFFPVKETSAFEAALSFFFTHIPEWDVLLLGGRVFQYTPTPFSPIVKVDLAFCAHAYAVHKKYYRTLLENYEETYDILQGEMTSFSAEQNCHVLDHRWNLLIPVGQWYFVEMLAQQREGVSDTLHKYRNRTHPNPIQSFPSEYI